jgi:hypothetical protein
MRATLFLAGRRRRCRCLLGVRAEAFVHASPMRRTALESWLSWAAVACARCFDLVFPHLKTLKFCAPQGSGGSHLGVLRAGSSGARL